MTDIVSHSSAIFQTWCRVFDQLPCDLPSWSSPLPNRLQPGWMPCCTNLCWVDGAVPTPDKVWQLQYHFIMFAFQLKGHCISSKGKSTRKRLLSYSHTQSQTLERRRLSPKSLKRALNPALCVASVNAEIPKCCQVYWAGYGRPRTLLQAQQTHKAWLFLRITLLSTNPWL